MTGKWFSEQSVPPSELDSSFTEFTDSKIAPLVALIEAFLDKLESVSSLEQDLGSSLEALLSIINKKKTGET